MNEQSGRQIDAFLEELKNKQEGKASTPSASRGRLFDEPPLKVVVPLTYDACVDLTSRKGFFLGGLCSRFSKRLNMLCPLVSIQTARVL